MQVNPSQPLNGRDPGGLADELLERIKGELSKLGPILELEIVREPDGSRTEGGLTVGSRTIEYDRRSGA